MTIHELEIAKQQAQENVVEERKRVCNKAWYAMFRFLNKFAGDHPRHITVDICDIYADPYFRFNIAQADADGKDIFGAGFYMCFYTVPDRFHPTHIGINCGTCGEYSGNDAAQVQRVFDMAAIWRNEQQLVDELLEIKLYILQDLYENHSNYDRQLTALQHQAREEKLIEIESNVKVGNVYEDRKQRRYKVVRITPKRFYVESSWKPSENSAYRILGNTIYDRKEVAQDILGGTWKEVEQA